MSLFAARRPRWQVVLASGALALTSVSGVHAQTLGPQVSITIVEPKDQSKWGYAPGMRKVAPGTWVTWSNNGQDEHTVTAVDGSFDSQTLEPSDGFSWYFDQPGTQVQYICSLHPWMQGTIIVTGDAPPPPPPDPGTDVGGG
jgi:plastocyanin